MTRVIAALILAVCVAWLLFAGQLIAPSSANGALICPNDCIQKFAQGCYTGNGTSQTITDGITDHGIVMIWNKKVSGAAASTYRSAEMGANGADVSAFIGGAGGATLVSGRITSWADGSFTVGSNLQVNSNVEDYCYFSWGRSRLMGTFTYLGDTGIATPRTISLPHTPDVVVIQLPDDNGAGFPGNMYIRTQDMPANTSYGWHNVAETPPTQVIRNLTTNGFVVGSILNQNGKTYRGFWFAQDSTWGRPFTWTGNGTGGGGVNCADASKQQTVSPVCEPILVMTFGCGGGALICEHDCLAAGHAGTAPIIRGTNMGSAVVGPGNTTNNFISLFATGGLFGDELGDLGVSGFTVAGDGSFAHSLNDNGQTPFSWVQCAPGCVFNP